MAGENIHKRMAHGYTLGKQARQGINSSWDGLAEISIICNHGNYTIG